MREGFIVGVGGGRMTSWLHILSFKLAMYGFGGRAKLMIPQGCI